MQRRFLTLKSHPQVRTRGFEKTRPKIAKRIRYQTRKSIEHKEYNHELEKIQSEPNSQKGFFKRLWKGISPLTNLINWSLYFGGIAIFLYPTSGIPLFDKIGNFYGLILASTGYGAYFIMGLYLLFPFLIWPKILRPFLRWVFKDLYSGITNFIFDKTKYRPSSMIIPPELAGDLPQHYKNLLKEQNFFLPELPKNFDPKKQREDMRRLGLIPTKRGK